MAFTEADRQRIANCLARTPGAWEEFVDRYLGLLVHVIQHTAHAHSVNVSQADVEDLCSEIFVTLLSNNFAVLRHFKGNAALGTYLAVIARRIAVHGLAQRRKAQAMGHVTATPSALDSVGATSTATQRMEDLEDVRHLLNQLPASEAAVVKAYHLDGKSYREISQSLNIPENSIGPTLTRARERMRQMRTATT
ncbi:MAG: sigma-70 family RNA polymerase sigma factor [Planctomycetaceae bacterium]|nr:sigma-70 family RNA polymerase sigma factor [Planctomycetaceae bacterium]